MRESIRSAYRRLIAILKPNLQQGSTVRALVLALAPSSVMGGLADAEKLPALMLACALLAALIPDELP